MDDLARHPENQTVPGIVVLRPETGLFFANADTVREAVKANLGADTKAVVLDAETVPTIDVTAVSMLVQLAEDLRHDGIELVLARDIATVRELVRLGNAGTPLKTYATVRAAIGALEPAAGAASV